MTPFASSSIDTNNYEPFGIPGSSQSTSSESNAWDKWKTLVLDMLSCGCTTTVSHDTISKSPTVLDRSNSLLWRHDSFAAEDDEVRDEHHTLEDDQSDVSLNDWKEQVGESFDVERVVSETRFHSSPPRKDPSADDATCATVTSDSSYTYRTHSSIHHDDTFLYDIELHKMTKPLTRHWSDTGSHDPALEAIAKLQAEGRVLLSRLRSPRYEL